MTDQHRLLIAASFHRSQLSDRVLAGAVLGAAAAIVAVAFGIPGLTLFAVASLLLALAPPRFALAAGFLMSAGTLWLFFATVAVIGCATNPSSCSGPAPGPFAVASGLVLGTGVLLFAATHRRMNPSRDTQRR